VYETIFKAAIKIKCIEKIENNSKVCVFNIGSPSVNSKLYCKLNKYDYICYDNEIDFESTFETFKDKYDICCHIGQNVYIVTKSRLEKLKGFGNIKYDDCFHFRCNSKDYKQVSRPLFATSVREIKSNTFFSIVNDDKIVKKINDQFNK
jgi:hypothetical protein